MTASTYRINREYFAVEIVDEIRINEDEIGLVKAKCGSHLPLGQRFGNFVECNNFQDAQAFIENGGQQGKQLAILANNTYSINTWVFDVEIRPVTKIPLGEIGLVIANDGKVIPPNRRLGRSVECNNFEDAQAFINNGGECGPQLAILRDGKKYQINTELFTIITSTNAEQYGLISEQLKCYEVKKDFIGIVTTTEGKTGRLYGTRIESHSNFREPQKFIDAGGYKGLQEEVLLEGPWALNPWFVRVEQAPLVDIPVHCIAILWNNFHHNPIDHESENSAITIRKTGKCAINTAIYKVYIVPINEIRVRWWYRSTRQGLEYPPLVIPTPEEKKYLLNLILEFTIRDDSIDKFVKNVSGNLNESNVVSNEHLISTFVEGTLEEIVAEIYRCEMSPYNDEKLKTDETQEVVRKTATSKIIDRCKHYYIEIKENKEKELMSFFFFRDKEEM